MRKLTRTKPSSTWFFAPVPLLSSHYRQNVCHQKVAKSTRGERKNNNKKKRFLLRLYRPEQHGKKMCILKVSCFLTLRNVRFCSTSHISFFKKSLQDFRKTLFQNLHNLFLLLCCHFKMFSNNLQ